MFDQKKQKRERKIQDEEEVEPGLLGHVWSTWLAIVILYFFLAKEVAWVFCNDNEEDWGLRFEDFCIWFS